MDLIPTFGAPGLAIGLTGFLWFGTRTGGKVKPLGWWWTLFLAMLAGSAYNAAGTPFDLISSLVMSLLGLFGAVVPRATMAGIALFLAGVILYKKLSTREVAVIGLVFFYVATGAGGGFTILAEKITVIMNSFAS
ncbi:hypothetical protein EES44_24530 [Streptomyces sp. ADI96-15]|uniref:hypothetical protein n=1 Tax=Streptomyces sp. ADI96-15 TaxID=1522761 RepID=UPI000F55753A|nr:hypothetical protein [Streptomyces sp. ADI96-15]RPK58102.1 hypothetical protein EES44_24530 [Streptomyces sp. ADI96-15]